MTSMQPADVSAAIARALHAHWKLLLVEGIVLLVLGAAAIAIPPLAGLAATIWLGWIFIIGGIVGIYTTLKAQGMPGYGLSLLSAILALLAGALLLWNPMQGLVTLTYVLIAFFLIDGLTMIFLAVAHRRELSGRWQWLAVNGVIDLILAVIILAGLPASTAWALGLLLGIDLVFGGATLIAMAMAAKNAAA